MVLGDNYYFISYSNYSSFFCVIYYKGSGDIGSEWVKGTSVVYIYKEK